MSLYRGVLKKTHDSHPEGREGDENLMLSALLCAGAPLRLLLCGKAAPFFCSVPPPPPPQQSELCHDSWARQLEGFFRCELDVGVGRGGTDLRQGLKDARVGFRTGLWQCWSAVRCFHSSTHTLTHSLTHSLPFHSAFFVVVVVASLRSLVPSLVQSFTCCTHSLF